MTWRDDPVLLRAAVMIQAESEELRLEGRNTRALQLKQNLAELLDALDRKPRRPELNQK